MGGLAVAGLAFAATQPEEGDRPRIDTYQMRMNDDYEVSRFWTEERMRNAEAPTPIESAPPDESEELAPPQHPIPVEPPE